MSNLDLITDEYWEVDNGDGTGFHSLNTLAYNISTLQGKYSIPPRRGDNFVPARRPGQGYVSKVRDARPLSLSMNLVGRAPDGTVPLRSQSQVLNNYMQLQRLFAVYDRQITIRRRFYELQPDGVTFALVIATCQAEMTGTMEYNPNGPTAGKTVIELTMHDPLWYRVVADNTSMTGTTTTNNFGDNTFGDGGFGGLIGVASTVTVTGTAPSAPIVQFTGPSKSPSVTYTPPGGTQERWFTVEATIDAGDAVVVNFKERTIMRQSDQALHMEFLRPGSVWFELDPGTVTLTAYAEFPTSTTDTYVQWSPAYY